MTKMLTNVKQPLLGRGANGVINDEFEPCWELLQQALIDIHRKDAGKLSFEQLYRASYKIVLRKKGDVLYDHVKDFEENWFRQHVIPRIEGLLSRNLLSITLVNQPNSNSSTTERRELGEKFLKGIREAWEDHNLAMNMTADVLMYLDRTYSSENGRPSLWATTIGLFRDSILKARLGSMNRELDANTTIFDVVNAVMLDLINLERDGDVVDRSLVHAIANMLDTLYETNDELENQRLYLTVFEPALIGSTREYYQKEAQMLVRESDASNWLRHTQRRLEQEYERCQTTLIPSSTKPLAKILEEELISAHLKEFLDMEASGLKAMIDHDRIEDLSILYALVYRIDDKVTPLKDMIQTRVLELGLEIEQVLKRTDFSVPQTGAGADGNDDANVKTQPLNQAAQQTAAAIKWVDDVLTLKDKFDNLLDKCFENNLVLHSAITKSFSDFINMFARCAEYVSLFIDENLKRGIRGKTEAEVDVVLEKAIVLLRYLTDKDLFERYYQKHLGRRLLQGKSESQDAEKEMISRMKQAMGNTFTSKFEGMFKDMELSHDLSNGYREYVRGLGEVDNAKIDLNIHVLTTNNWPPEVMGRGVKDNDQGEVHFPPSISQLKDSFFKYYLKDRSGRVLTWVATAGTADIKCVFPKIPGKETGPLSKERRYELNVSTYGMIVLLLFNSLSPGSSLSFGDIQEKTNIPVSDLTRTLASISLAPKSRVLAKDGNPKKVDKTDNFTFNASFVSKTIRIKAPTINSTSKVEADDERKETEKKNDQTRAHIIDAAIVRIMK